MICHVV